jgi:hypothetical protein
MSAQVNLINKMKKRKFPLWGAVIGIALVNIFIFLFISESETNGHSIPLPEAQSRIIGGSIAHDGESFWATGMLITFGARTERDIIQFDKDGKVLNVFTPEQDFCGLAFDGTRLWTADAAGSGPYALNGKFYTVDRGNGRLVEQFTINRDYLLDGIAASEYRLWVIGRYRGGDTQVFLWEIDQYSKAIAHEVALSKGDFVSCTGVTYFQDYLYAVVGVDYKQVVKISTYEGRVVNRFDFSERDIYGITNDGKDVLVADGSARALLTLDATR